MKPSLKKTFVRPVHKLCNADELKYMKTAILSVKLTDNTLRTCHLVSGQQGSCYIHLFYKNHTFFPEPRDS